MPWTGLLDESVLAPLHVVRPLSAQDTSPSKAAVAAFVHAWSSLRSPGLSLGASGPRVLAPPGWTLDRGIVDIVAPLVLQRSASPVAAVRAAEAALAGSADVVHFDGLDAASASALLDALPPTELESRHCGAPQLGAILRAISDSPGDIAAAGYLVSPGRSDERLALDTITVRFDRGFHVSLWHVAGCQCAEMATELQMRYGLEPLRPPEEMWPTDEVAVLPATWRMWWGQAQSPAADSGAASASASEAA